MMKAGEEIELGEIKINAALNLATQNGQSLGLEPKWVQVFAVLARHANKPVTRESIIQSVWADYIVGEDSLNRAISQIRKGIASYPNVQIDTIRGIGYQLIYQPNTVSADKDKSPATLPLPRGRKWLIASITLVAVVLAAWLISQNQVSTEAAVKYHQTVVTTDLGIENSPSISPDNKYIAYMWNNGDGELRKIYIKELGTQNTVKFTSGKFIEKSPTWSGDGSKLAYFSTQPKGEILMISPFLVNQPTPLDTVLYSVIGSSISWGKNDNEIIYSGQKKAGDTYKIYRYDRSSNESTILLSSDKPTAHYAHATFSPDKAKIAVLMREKLNLEKPIELNQTNSAILEIYAYPEMTMTYRRKIDAPIHSVTWKNNSTLIYTIQRDGQYHIETFVPANETTEVLYSSENILRNPVHNMASQTTYFEAWYGNVNMKKAIWQNGQLTDVKNFLSSSRYDWSPVLTRDEQKLAFLSIRSGRTQVWLHDFGSDYTKQLSHFDTEQAIRSMAWNGKGTQLVMDRLEDRNQGRAVIMGLDGKVADVVYLPGKSIHRPTWSKDDQSLYFVLGDGDGNTGNWRYDLKSKEMTQLPLEAMDLKQVDEDFYYMKGNQRGIWKAPVADPSQETLVDWRHTELRTRYWGIINDTLMMFNLHNYNSTFEAVDLKTGNLIDSIPIPGFIPNIEPGAVFFRDKRVIYTIVDGLETEIIALKQND